MEDINELINKMELLSKLEKLNKEYTEYIRYLNGEYEKHLLSDKFDRYWATKDHVYIKKGDQYYLRKSPLQFLHDLGIKNIKYDLICDDDYIYLYLDFHHIFNFVTSSSECYIFYIPKLREILASEIDMKNLMIKKI